MGEPVFYFGAMSPYSWLAAERIGEVLPSARWQGVLTGVIHAAHGRVSWGRTEDRERGLADCELRAGQRGLGPLRWPQDWPSHDLTVTRAMLYAEQQGALESYALAAMRLAFQHGRSLTALETVLDAAAQVGLDGSDVERGIAEQHLKDALRHRNEEALALGVFGVPTVVVHSELFWGDDRLEDAARAAGAATS